MRGLVATILALLAFQGCATTPQEMPVTPQTQRNFNGFSIEPPQGSNWVVITLRDDTVILEKRSPTLKHRVILGVERSPVTETFSSPDEYLQFVKKRYFVADPRYYKFYASEADLTLRYGSFCVKTYYNYEQTVIRAGAGSKVIHEGRCYVCLHPEDSDYEFEICKSEEYIPGQRDNQLAAEEENFIEHFAFSSLVRKSRLFLLQDYTKQFFPTVITVDGRKVTQLSHCAEVAIVDSSPGEHTISAAFSVTVVKTPTTTFHTVDGESNYFLVREKGSDDKFSQINVYEVPEIEWLDRARAGLEDPDCKGGILGP